MQAGMASLFGFLADVPLDDWERQPHELVAIPEAELPDLPS